MKDLRQIIKDVLKESVNKKLIKVIPNKYVYHGSAPYYRDKISKEGLMPKGKSEAWLSDTPIDGEVIFATNSEDKNVWFDSTYDDDRYRIDTTKLTNKWFRDPNGDDDDWIITFEPISLNAIELIYMGTGEDTL